MKRSLVIIGVICSFSLVSLVPQDVQAVIPTSSAAPLPLASVAPTTTPNPTTPSPTTKRVEREAARAAYRASIEQAENGRDLAFADANATLMQSLSTAGKDRDVRKAAHNTYKVSATGIVTIYKQSIAQALLAYKAALALIKEK
ncbi:MAG: hypothetical protein WDN07_02240 [Actinomycetota bacterium]